MSAVAFAAVDWGTTRLRVWLFDRAGSVLAERRSDEGLLAARPDRFGAILERHLAELGAPPELPVVICGMAGARQGWVEAPYVIVPAAPDGIFEAAIRVPGAAREIRIVPGLAQRDETAPDVMRGEETQLAGAIDRLGPGRHLVCMPGTHSKWVLVEDRVVSAFQTVMTGELFSLLSSQSILSHAIGPDAPPVQPQSTAFRHGCASGLAQSGWIAVELFRIRAASLLAGLEPADAAALLSGLLIGTEIGACRERFGGEESPVTLIASGAMRDLYAAALAEAGMGYTAIDADEAVRDGLCAAARQYGLLGAAGR